MKLFHLPIVCFLVALIFTGCKNDPKHIDVSHINVDLEVKRFEQDFFKVNPKDMDADLLALQQQYPNFLPGYIEQVMEFGRMDDTLKRYRALIEMFLTNKSIEGLYDTVMLKYSNVNWLQPQVEEVLKHYQYYFPQKPVPNALVTYISEFGPAAITYGNDIIGISLDDYLGSNYRYYPSVGFYEYQLHRLTKQNMVPNIARTLAQDIVPEKPNEETKLLDKMIRMGKIYLITEHLVPNAEAHLISGYTKEQEAWCQRYEGNIWAFFIENELLYSIDHDDIRRNLTDGPTTQGMPEESPANTGSWLGWQICKKYVAMHDENGLQKLLKEKSAQQILSKSKYKPKN